MRFSRQEPGASLRCLLRLHVLRDDAPIRGRRLDPGRLPLAPDGVGRLIFADASTAAGTAYTDDGAVHEHRGLKGRTKGRSTESQQSRRPVRRVPIPPELVQMLRDHINQFGVGADKRIFRSENGNVIQPSTWWRAWQKVRLAALSSEQAQTPLLRRPYDLRHSGVTWRLNSGVPATEVAAWAGHSVEVLMRVYAKCMTGLEDVWITRMDDTLHLQSQEQSSRD